MNIAIATLLLLALALPAGAQTLQELKVDMSSATAAAPKELLVDDWSRVRVTVTKNMFHVCTVETKTEALPAPVNPVGQILGVLGGFIGGGGVDPGRSTATDNLAKQVDALVDDVKVVRQVLDEQLLAVLALTKRLPTAVSCGAPVGSKDACDDVDTAKRRLETLASDIQTTPKDPIASTVLLSARAGELAKALMARMVKDTDDPGLQQIFSRLRYAQEQIDAANGRRDALVKARDALLVVRERVLGFTPSKMMTFPLSPVGNSRTVATVSCSNVVMQEPLIYFRPDDHGSDVPPVRIAPVAGTVTFRKVPWATVTAGLLSSSVDKREVGIANNKTGTDPETKTVMFDRRVAVVEEGASQLIPFTFFNVAIPRLSNHRMYVAGTVGVGLNPHNGPKNLEYFLGGSIGIGRFVAINIGRHFGTRMEPDNDFAVGDVLPSGLTAIPTRRERDRGFAIGVSYGLPLPK